MPPVATPLPLQAFPGAPRASAEAMAVFSGPAPPVLSLNPREDAKFQKEVAQVRKRATQVSRLCRFLLQGAPRETGCRAGVGSGYPR